MRRGDVWRVSFEGSLGGEIRKSRPAVIVSNNAANKHANRIQIVPFSSKTGKLYPCDTTVTMNGAVSKAMADQITTVTKTRLLELVGQLDPHDMERVEMAMRVQLGLAI